MDIDRSAIGRKSRRKGSSFERSVAKLLSEWWFGDNGALRRAPLSGGWTEKSQGDIVVDPTFVTEIKWPYYAECKNLDTVLRDKQSIFKWFRGSLGSLQNIWKETRKEATQDCRSPMLIFKGSRTPIFVAISSFGPIYSRFETNDTIIETQIQFTSRIDVVDQREPGLSAYILLLEELLKIRPN